MAEKQLGAAPSGTTDAATKGYVDSAVAGTTLGDTFLGVAFENQKTQRSVTLTASLDFVVFESLEIASGHMVEIPSTSTLEVVHVANRRATRTTTVNAPGATPTIDLSLGDQQINYIGLAAAITGFVVTGTPFDGQRIMLRFKDNGTARAIAWDSAYFVSSGVATLLSTTVISKTHMVGLVYDQTAGKLVCMAVDSTGY